MLGFFSGVVLAVWYRNQGPQKPVYEWMEEEEESGGEGENGGIGDEDEETKELNIINEQPATINIVNRIVTHRI
jgi:hypothetical protein